MKTFLVIIKNKIKWFTTFKKINPHRHWNNLLHVFFTIVLLLIVFSFYLLLKIKDQQIFQADPTVTDPTTLLDEKLLEKFTESFDLKLIKETEIRDGLKNYKDPSLN